MMTIVLKDVVNWRALRITKKYDDKPEHHYTTIRKMFNRWSKENVFKLAYDKMIEAINKRNGKKVKKVFIDSTFIDNKTGSEMVGINPLNFKKRVTKLLIICDDDKNILNIKEFKTTMNDCMTIEKTIEGVKLKGRINLIGDQRSTDEEENKINSSKKEESKEADIKSERQRATEREE